MSDPVTLLLGDCIERMKELPDSSVDAVVTDPPYDLLTTSRNGSRRINDPDNPAGRSARGFMGKTWDGTGIGFRVETWAEAFRVAKPGAHLLAFGGTRTYHRLTAAIEDAGWEIRDCLVWAYASGFPKSLNLGNGWGTALKPAWEPIVMARKPLRGTVAQNVAAYGTGALNIDGTRITWRDPLDAAAAAAAAAVGYADSRARGTAKQSVAIGKESRDGTNRYSPDEIKGRWPANLLLSDPELFDEPNSGVVGSGATILVDENATARRHATEIRDPYAFWGERDRPAKIETAAGRKQAGNAREAEEADVVNLGPVAQGYSRFFLIPKAARSDREPLLRGQLELKDGNKWNAGGIGERRRQAGQDLRRNNHPTVKPLDLMRHLVRLVTPPGGLILDPFLGSGTTAIAALEEGFRVIGIEKEPEYMKIAEARLNGRQVGLGLDVAAPTRKRTSGGGLAPSLPASPPLPLLGFTDEVA